MNILLLGDAPDTRQILNRMLEKSRHKLIQQAWDDMPEPDLEYFDMVLVDGNICNCEQQKRLLEWVSEAKRRFPDIPLAALNNMGTAVVSQGELHHRASHSCGVSESANGVWNMHCRLREIALSETSALVREACEKQPMEPYVFEYSGRV